MVVWVANIVLLINFQILLADARGITLPITVADETTFEALLTNQKAILEDIPSLCNSIASNKPQDAVSRVDIPKLPLITIPYFDDCFKLVLDYGKECALRYSQYNKVQPFVSNEYIADPSMFSMKPIFSVSNTAIDESILLSSPVIKLPLKTSNIVTSLDQSSIKSNIPFDIVSESSKSLSPCFDLSISPSETKPPSLNLPLSLPCTVASPSLPISVLMTESLDLSQSSFISRNSAVPCSSVPPVSIVDSSCVTKNTITSVETPRSTLSLPLAVTCTTTSFKPALHHDCLPLASPDAQLSPPLSSSLLHSQLHYNNDEIYAPSSNTISNPATPFPLIDYDRTLYSSSTVPTPPQTTTITSITRLNEDQCSSIADNEYISPIASKSFTLPSISVQYPHVGVPNLASSLNTYLTSSPGRACNSPKPLLTSYVEDTLHFQNSLPNIASQRLSINNHTSKISALKSSSSIPLSPFDSSCGLPLSPSPLISNSLPLCVNIPLTEISDSSNMIPHSSGYDNKIKSFKRSTNQENNLSVSENDSSPNVDFIYNTIEAAENEPSSENSDEINSIDESSIKKLQELLYLIEILTDEDKCDDKNINELMKILFVLTN